MAKIRRPSLSVKPATGINYRLGTRRGNGSFVRAALDFVDDYVSGWITIVTPIAQPKKNLIKFNRPMSLRLLVDLFTNVFDVQEFGRLGTTIDKTKDQRVLTGPYSLMRGAYRGDYATTSALSWICWLILDYDFGLQPIDLQRISRFLHVRWTTMSDDGSKQRWRVAILVRPVVDVAGHDALRHWFMHDYPAGQHHDIWTQAAILPVRRIGTDGWQANVTIFGNVGELLNVGLLGQVPVAVLPQDIPDNAAPDIGAGFRLANALKQNAAAVCRFVGITLGKFTIKPSADTHFHIRCPFPGHVDKRASATVTIFQAHKRDVWVMCHACAAKGFSKFQFNMPIDLFYWAQRFKGNTNKVRLTNQQLLRYNARLLHDAQVSDRPDDFPWSQDIELLIAFAVSRGATEIPAQAHRKRQLFFAVNDQPISITITALRQAYDDTNLMFACNHFIHSSHTSALDPKFMSEWCRLSRSGATYRKARSLFASLGIIEPDSISANRLRQPILSGAGLSPRKQPKRTPVIYQAISI